MALYNQFLDGRNTFYWEKHAYALAAGDYTKAVIRHWTHLASNHNIASPVLESIKYPLENRIGHNYPGSTVFAGETGTLNKPSGIGRRLDDGSTQLSQLTYNDAGHPIDVIDPAGREMQFLYAANQIDLVRVVRRFNPSYLSTLAIFTNTSFHRPASYTDAAGKTTSFGYNSNQQVKDITNPLIETSGFGYDPKTGDLLNIVMLTVRQAFLSPTTLLIVWRR